MSAESGETRPPSGGLLLPYFRILARRRGDRARIAALLAVMLGAALLEVLGIGLVMPFIALLEDPSVIERAPAVRDVLLSVGVTSRHEIVLAAGVALVIAFVVKNTYLALANSLQLRFVYRRMVLLSRHLLEYYLTQPYAFHLSTNSAELVRNVITEAALIFTAPMPSLFVILIEGITVVVVGLFLVALEPVAVPIAAVVVGGLAVVLQRLFLGRIVRLGAASREHQAAMMKWANQALGGIKEIQILRCERYFLDRFESDVAAQAAALREYRVTALLPRYVLETLGVVGLVTVSGVVLSRGDDAATLLPLLGVLAVAVVRLLPSAARIVGAMTDVRYYATGAAKLASELADHERSDRPRAIDSGSRDAPPLEFDREIRVVDLDVRYPGAERSALEGVDLTIRRGETIALVGASGAGKTTLADTLIGLLDPSRGEIRIDGTRLGAGDRLRWQRLIGYIPQSVYLCDDTLRRNIAFGVHDGDIDEHRLRATIRDARLDELVASLPQGLDTTIGERGVRLSGGQRQRIGIARALYLDPKVLLLDEATSALDGVTEREIVEAIERLRGDRTTIVIAHRLSTVRHCDRVVLLEGGRVAQVGAWEDVLSRSERFREMVRAAGAA